jgi:secretion/DNA translocation related TadE-like protein
VWVTTVIAALWVVAVLSAQVAMARVARHRVRSAADLAALAVAARALSEGAEAACGRGAAVAAANGARLTRCGASGGTADVTAAMEIAFPLLGRRSVRARARAAPADPVSAEAASARSEHGRGAGPVDPG